MQLLVLLSALAIGALVGAVNYSLLWRTLERLPRIRRPAAWLAASGALRSLIVWGGLFLVHGSWQGLLACLVGLLGARHLAVRRQLAGPD